MALGAYSIVRFSNNVSDQRVNLGVIVWHPNDGYRWRFSPSVDRAQAVDPRARVQSLRDQLQGIETHLGGVNPSAEGVLHQLNSTYREGLEVTLPYPARIQSPDETLDHLYELLVFSIPDFRRASSQRQFERSFQAALKIAVQQVDPHIKLNVIGQRKIEDMRVNVGIQTSAEGYKALWHPLSFQSQKRPEDQLTLAKATAMDIRFIREHPNGFKGHDHIVALQQPRPQVANDLKDSLAWLKGNADDVLVVRTIEELPSMLETRIKSRLKKTAPHHRH